MAEQISLVQSILLVLTFVFWAAFCTVSNKKLMSEAVESSNFMFLMQAILTVLYLRLMTLAGVVSPATTTLVIVQENGAIARQIWIAMAYTCNVAFGLCSLHYVSIPVFGALKRLTILACWIGEYSFFRNNGTILCIPALLTMVTGTLIAGWQDIHFNAMGYLFGVASSAGQGVAFILSKLLDNDNAAVAKASGTALAKHTGGKKKSIEQVLSVVYTNACVSIVLMFLVLTLTGWSNLYTEQLLTAQGITHLLLNSVAITLLNLIIFLDCTLNSPLTHAVAGNLKAAVTSVVGLLFIHTELTFLGGVGLVLNLAGGACYTAVRYQTKAAKKDEGDTTTTRLESVVIETAVRTASTRLPSSPSEDRGNPGDGKTVFL
ncbi:hypothetical protein DIPPA_27134 [Diplonema papillatum]|nr:hypothetical protein DIPPA_27134 [Diplonema papillatum]